MAESNVGDMANVAGGLWNRYAANVVNNDEGIEKVTDVVKDVYDHIHEVDYNEENKTLFSYLSKLRFSYRVDPSEPSLLSYVNEIFKKSEDIKLDHEKYYRNYFTIMEEDNNYSNSYYLDDSRSFAKDVATGFNVEGCYGAFYLGALMSADYSSSSSYRTARYEKSVVAQKYICLPKREFKECPTDYLTAGFRETVGRYSEPEDLEEHLGTFYAWKINLGGCIKKSFVMEISEDDDQEKIEAELKVQFGPKFLTPGSAGSSTKYSKRKNNKTASLKTETTTKGGKPELWLAESDELDESSSNTSESIQQQWANSFDNTNLYPIAYELKPIWELVKNLDKDKGERFEVYLKDKWEKHEIAINGASFLNSKIGHSLENLKEIIKFCNDYANTCEEQLVRAKNKIESFSFIIHLFGLKRFDHWKDAAEKGKQVFTQLIVDIDNPRKTIKEFSEFVEKKSSHFRIHAEENKGPYWSELYKSHAEKLMEVFKMVEEGRAKLTSTNPFECSEDESN